MPRSIVLMLLVAVALGGCSSKKSDQAILADAKDQILKGCLAKGKATNALPADRLDAFCRCSAGKTVDALGIEGVKRLSKAAAPSAADQEKMKGIPLACLKEAGGQ